MADTKLTPEEQAELDQLNGVSSRKLSKSDQDELDELNGVKKKVDTIPSQSVSGSGISKSTSGVSAQPKLTSLSDLAPKGTDKFERVTPFVETSPKAFSGVGVEERKVRDEVTNVAKIKGVDKNLLSQKLNEKIAPIQAELDTDYNAFDTQKATYDELNNALTQIQEQYNAEKSDSQKAVYKQKAEQIFGELKTIENDLNVIGNNIRKKEGVLTQVGRVSEATNRLKEYDKEIEKLKGRIDGSGTRDVFGKAFWNATIPSIVGGAGSLIEAGVDLNPTTEVLNQLNSQLPEEDRIQNPLKQVGQSLQDFSEYITLKNPEYAQKSMFSDEFNIESAANLAGSAAGSLASILVPTGAVGLATKGSATAIKLTQYGTSLSLGMNESYKAAKEAGLDDRDAAILAFSIALPVMAVDGLGADQFVSKIVTPNVMKNAAKEAAKQLGKGSADNVIFNIGKESALKQMSKEGAKGFLSEGGTEALQSGISSVGQEVYDVTQGGEFMTEGGAFKNTPKDAVFQAMEEGIVGGLTGGVSNLSLSTNSDLYNKAVEISNNPLEFEKFNRQLNLEVKSGNISQEEADNTMNMIAAIQETEATIPQNIKSKEARLAAINLIAEKKNLEAEIEGKEKSLVQPQVETIKTIDTALRLIAQGNSIEQVQKFVDDSKAMITPQEQVVEEQLTTPTETINEEVVQTPVTEQATEEVAPQELTYAEGNTIEYSKDGGKTFERATIQAVEGNNLEVIDEDGTPVLVDTNNAIINPINTEQNAVNQGNIEQSNIAEREGIVGQQQGQQENRQDQEAVIQEGETSPINRDFSTESGQEQEVGKDVKDKVFVHETDAETFDKFDLNKVGSGQGEQWLGNGIYLQEKGSFKIEKYGKNKIETILNPNAKIFNVENTPNGQYRDSFVEWAVKNTEVGKKKAQERIDDGLSLDNLLPRDILKRNPEAVEKLKEQGYDGLYLDGELVIYNPDVLQVKEAEQSLPTKEQQIEQPKTKKDGKQSKQKTGSGEKTSGDVPKQKTKGITIGKGKIPLDQRQSKDEVIISALALEPQELEDYVMQALISGKVKVTAESFKDEALKGKTEISKRVGILRTPEKGGTTVEKAAERIGENLPEGLYDQIGTQPIRNLIISILSQNESKKAIAIKLNEKYQAAPNTQIENDVLVNTSGEQLFETPYGLATQEQLDQMEADFALREIATDDDALSNTLADLEDLTQQEIDELYNIKDQLEFEKAANKILLQDDATKKSIADYLRSLKLDTRGKAFDATLGLPIAIWNSAIDVVATAIEAGVSAVEAVKRGLDYINTNYNEKWNEEEYNDRISNIISAESDVQKLAKKYKSESSINDSNGNPIVFYHGTPNKFNEFDTTKLGSNTGASSAQEAIFFSDNKNVSQSYIDAHRKTGENQNLEELNNIIDSMTFDEAVDFYEKVLGYKNARNNYDEKAKDWDYIKDDIKSAMANDAEGVYQDSKKLIEKASDFLKEKGIKFSPFLEMGQMVKAVLQAKKIKTIDAEGQRADDIGLTEIIQQAKEEGYDAVVVENVVDMVSLDDDFKGYNDEESTVVAIFDKKNIKIIQTEEQKPLNKQIADAIRKGKLKGGAQASFGLTAVWNTAIEIAAKFMESNAGATVTEAVQKAIEYLRTTDLYKSLNENQQAKVERNFTIDLNKSVEEIVSRKPPVPPAETKAAEKQGGEEKQSQFYQSVKAQMIDPKQTQKLSEVPNPMYVEMKNKETMDAVNKLIADNTIENLEAILLSDERSASLEGNVRVVAMIKLADALQEESVKLQESDKATSDTLFERSQKLYAEASQVLTKAGRTVQAAAMILYGYGNYQSAVMQFRKKVDKANEKSKESRTKAAKKDVEGVQNDIDESVAEVVEKVTKKYATKKKKTKEDILAKRKSLKDKFKANKGRYFNSSIGGLTKEGIEYAGELALTYIQEGILKASEIIDELRKDFKDEGYTLTEADEKKITSELGKVSLAEKLATMNETLAQITKQHYSTQKKKVTSLAKTIVDELGLSDVEAEQIAKEIEAELSGKLKDKLNDRFKKDLKRAKEKKDEAKQAEKKLAREEQKAQQGNEIDILLQAALDGNISEDLMQEMFAEKYGIAEITQDDLAYIKEQYEKIAKIGDPTSFIAMEFYSNIFDRINSKLPQSLISTLDQLWYSSVLSGPGTTDVNISFGLGTTIGAAVDGFWINIIRAVKNPKNAKLITQLYLSSFIEGLKGMNAGQQNGRYILANGTSSFVQGLSQLESAAQNETDFKRLMPNAKTLAKVLDASKYPLRFLSAQDAFFNEVLKSSKIFPYVYEKHYNDGLRGTQLEKAVTDEIRIGEDSVKAAEQKALSEVKIKYPDYTDEQITKTISYQRRLRDIINSRISKEAVDAATKASKNYVLTSDPDGFAGFLYQKIASFNNMMRAEANNSDSKAAKYGAFVATKIIPFIKVPLNIVNLGIDYSPLGFVKAGTGRALFVGTPRNFDLGQRELILSRAITGTLLTALVVSLNADDIFGDGLEGEEDEDKKKELKSKLAEQFKEKYGEELPLDHPLFMIPHEGQVSGSLSMLPPAQRDFLTKNGLSKEYAVYLGGKWISTNNVAAWASLGVAGSLANYNRYVTNNRYVESEAIFKKQDWADKSTYLMFGLAGQLLEMGSLKGTQSLIQNLDYKNGDLPTKATELLKTTLMQPLNILNPAAIRQTYKYIDGVSRFQPGKGGDAGKFLLQYTPLVGSIIAKGEKRHDSFGRDIKSFPGEGKGILGSSLMYAFGDQENEKEVDKILDLMYMSGIRSVPPLPKTTFYDVNNNIVEMSFSEWNELDRLAKQVAFEELKERTKGKEQTSSVTVYDIENKKLKKDNKEYRMVNLNYLANVTPEKDLAQSNNPLAKEIKKIYSRSYQKAYNDYMEMKGLSKEKNKINYED